MGELPISLKTEGGTLHIRKSGTAVDLVLDAALLERLGLKAGDLVHVVDSGAMQPSGSDRHARVMDCAERMMTKYERTLRALAQ